VGVENGVLRLRLVCVQVLDDEAEVFVVKMWRLLIYETEAKKLGLVKWSQALSSVILRTLAFDRSRN